MIIRTEQSSDKSQVKQLWRICFNDTDKFVEWFFKERWLPDYGLVAEDNGKIVAAMQGWPYILNVRGKKIPASMLAGVSTHPDYRGQGLMPKCLSLFMENTRSRGENIVFHTPARHTTFFKCLHYSASLTGFVSYNTDTRFFHDSEVVVEDVCNVSADKLLDVYTDNFGMYSGAVCRNLDDMALKLHDYASSDARLVYIKKNEKIIAYAVCMFDNENMTVEEFCAPSEIYRDKILNAVAAIGKGRSHIIKLPQKLIPNLPTGFSIESIPTGVMGAANIQSLLKTIAGFDDITVEIKDHMLISNCGKLKFNGEPTDGECDIIIDSGHLLQYLNGFSSIKEIVAENHCVVKNSSIIHILDERLPKTDCYVVEEY